MQPQNKVTAKAKAASAPSAHLKWTLHPSNKIVDLANTAKASLTSHQQAIKARQIAEADAAIFATGHDMQSTPEVEELLSVLTLVAIEVSLPELPSSAKRTNPTTDGDTDSNNDPGPVRHHKLYFV